MIFDFLINNLYIIGGIISLILSWIVLYKDYPYEDKFKEMMIRGGFSFITSWLGVVVWLGVIIIPKFAKEVDDDYMEM